VRVVIVASDGGRPSTVVSDGGKRINGGRESTAATAVSVTAADTTAVARFKRFDIQTHSF